MERKIASPVKRLAGFAIDWLIGASPFVYSVYVTVTSASIFKGLDSIMVGLTSVFFWYVVYALLNAYLTSKLGGTIGKMIVGTKVVNSNGKLISFKMAIFRNIIGYSVSGTIAYLGFIWILVDKKNHRAWHDLISDTYVVDMK